MRLLDWSNSWFTSQFIVVEALYTNVFSLNHILYDSCAISRSLLITSTIDWSLAGFSQLFQAVLTRFETWSACNKRWSLTDIVGGATLKCQSGNLDCEIFEDRPSAKIGSFENFRPYGNSNNVQSLIVICRTNWDHTACYILKVASYFIPIQMSSECICLHSKKIYNNYNNIMVVRPGRKNFYGSREG